MIQLWVILATNMHRPWPTPRFLHPCNKVRLNTDSLRSGTGCANHLEAPRSPFQNVRTNGRAFNSPNWRMKSTESPPPTSPSPRTSTSRTTFSRPGSHVPQAIAEGRRVYVGNMPYTAKSEDVEALFTAAEFSMYALNNFLMACPLD